MKVNAKGVVTIPASIRKKLGFTPGTEVEFSGHGNVIYLKKVGRSNDSTRRPRKSLSLVKDEDA